MAKRIEITIDPKGVCTTDTSGFKGKKCIEATKLFEDMLGPMVGERELKSEFYPAATKAQVEIQTDDSGQG